MPLLFWDASALAKRYAVEMGSDTVDALFVSVARREMITTVWGYAETYSILLRKLNSRRLDAATFSTAVTALQAEVIDDPDFGFLTIDDSAILAGISLMKKHNLNTSDAALLAVLQRYVRAQPPGSPTCMLVTADGRLLRAAQAERLPTLDPEATDAADVPGLLARF